MAAESVVEEEEGKTAAGQQVWGKLEQGPVGKQEQMSSVQGTEPHLRK